MSKRIWVGNKIIGTDKPCFIIAEAGVNHNGKLEIAKKLVDKAIEIKADAIKFQTFKAEDIIIKQSKKAEYQARNEDMDLNEESQFEMLKRLELSYDEFIELKQYCDKRKIIFLSTPHSSFKDIDLLNSLGVEAFKIGSGDLTNLPFLDYIARKHKPMILATGMSYLWTIEEAIKIICNAGNNEIILLHCTTNYNPCPFDEVNLKAMKTIKKSFPFMVGYSDHTEGITVPIMAATLEARIIEKHFTLDRAMKGPDHKISLEPIEFREMVRQIKLVEEALGSETKSPTKTEYDLIKIVRKSVVANQDIFKNELITKEMLAIKRPGTGLAPKYFSVLIGKKAKRNFVRDELFKLEDLRS